MSTELFIQSIEELGEDLALETVTIGGKDFDLMALDFVTSEVIKQKYTNMVDTIMAPIVFSFINEEGERIANEENFNDLKKSFTRLSTKDMVMLKDLVHELNNPPEDEAQLEITNAY